MEWVECIECLLTEQYKDHMTEQLADLLTKSSKQQLALLVATFTVSQMDKNKNDDKFIIMDSDGEDDPEKIKEIVKLVDKKYYIMYYILVLAGLSVRGPNLLTIV